MEKINPLKNVLGFFWGGGSFFQNMISFSKVYHHMCNIFIGNLSKTKNV